MSVCIIPSFHSPHTDQSSELSVALKRSQNELATALSECQALRAQHSTVQVNPPTPVRDVCVCVCVWIHLHSVRLSEHSTPLCR